MTMARTFQACETIVQTAAVKAEDILRVTGAVNNDLVAAEARYHKACHATYICKNNLHYEGRQEISYDVSFQKNCLNTCLLIWMVERRLKYQR